MVLERVITLVFAVLFEPISINVRWLRIVVGFSVPFP